MHEWNKLLEHMHITRIMLTVVFDYVNQFNTTS